MRSGVNETQINTGTRIKWAQSHINVKVTAAVNEATSWIVIH